MGLLIPQIEWLASQLVKNEICGSVLQIGKIDFFVTQAEFEVILINVGAARKSDIGIELIELKANTSMRPSIMKGLQENE